MLVIQIIIKQWDKSQLSASYVHARQAIPDRYVIDPACAQVLFDDQVMIDQHGDDLLGNRIQYLMTEEDFMLDRFRFSLRDNSVDYKRRVNKSVTPITVANLDTGWLQARYDWRYRVEEGGFVYWLYEEVILNACVCQQMDSDMFLDSAPKHYFEQYELAAL